MAEKVDEKAKKEEEIGKFREQQPFVPKFLTNDLRYLAMMSMNLKRNGVKNHLQQCVKRIFKERWPEEFELREAGIGKKQIWEGNANVRKEMGTCKKAYHLFISNP